MDTIESRLSVFPNLHLSVLPTPIHELTVLSEMFGCRVFCKRDDLTGFGFGGNKSRKLDFLVSEAKSQKCDTLLAVGANQSNFCRMVAAYGSANDMEVHLLLGGKKPEKPTGNLLLDHLLGAICHHVDTEDWDIWEKETRLLEEKLTSQGKKVYRMPIGGSTPTGALGYVSALGEIMDDEQRFGINFDAIVFATSSAGTQAGLVVGKALGNWPGSVIGVSVAKSAEHQMRDVIQLAEETSSLLEHPFDPGTVIVDDSYLGEGYAYRTESCGKAVQLFSRKLGIFLDNVYTGKAAAGLIDYLRTGTFGKNSTILFLHTGGYVELFE